MPYITRILHTTTWDYFALGLPDRFHHSPKTVKEAIMTDIDSVEEFWRTSSDVVVGASFFAMRRLFKLLQGCSDNLKVCFDFISIFATAVYLADKTPQMANSYSPQLDLNERIRAKFKILLDGCQKMFDQLLVSSKSKDLDDMIRFLPGVIVQKHLSIQGMADLYRIKPDLLERLIKSTLEPLRPSHVSFNSCFIMDDYLSGFLQDRDRSQLYYCDPMLQHISICRHFLSLLERYKAFDLQ